jgi:hypothetical protein
MVTAERFSAVRWIDFGDRHAGGSSWTADR